MVVLGIDMGTVWTKAALSIDDETGHHLVPLELDADTPRDYGKVGFVMQSTLYYKGIKNFIMPDTNPSDITYKIFQFDVGQKAVNSMYSSPDLRFFYDRIKPGIDEGDEDLAEIQEGFKAHMLAAAMIYHITNVAMSTLRRLGSTCKIDKYVVSVPATTREGDHRWKSMRNALLVPSNDELTNQLKIREEDITILREPEAAGYFLLRDRPTENGKFYLVYDFGGGTFDCSILKSREGVVVLKGSAEHSSVGRNQLGGNDIDELIHRQLYLQNPALEETLITLGASRDIADRARLETLRDAIYHLPGRVKLALSHEDHYSETTLFNFRISRAEFEEMIRGLVSTSIACCDDLLDTNGLGWKDVSGVLMVGGTSRIPLIRRMLEEHISYQRPAGAEPVTILLEEGESGICAVASGCAMYHHIKPGPDHLLKLGLKELSQSHFSDAEFFFEKARLSGDTLAPYFLGMLHYLGLSPDDDGPDYKLAFRFFEMEDTPFALFQRAVCFIKAQGVKRDETKALTLLRQLENTGLKDKYVRCAVGVLCCIDDAGNYALFYDPCFSPIIDLLHMLPELTRSNKH